jgi:uncharacterized protein (TIGR02246 family)
MPAGQIAPKLRSFVRVGEVISQAQQEVAMMKRALMLAALSAVFAVPAFAQQSGAITEQQKQAVQAEIDKYVKAFNSKDAKGLAGLYAEDGMLVGSFEMLMGRAAIEKNVTEAIQQGQLGSDLVVEPDWKMAVPLGNNLILNAGTWAATVPTPPVAQSTGQSTAGQGSSQPPSGASQPPSQLNLKPGDRMHGSYTAVDEIRGSEAVIRSLSYNVGNAPPPK